MSCSDKENNVVLCFNSELSMVLSFVTKKATALKSVVKYLLGCGDAMNNLIAKSNYNNYMSRFRHFRLSYLQQWKCKWMTCSEPITLTKEGFGCTSFILRFVMGLLSHSSFRQPQLAVYGATRQGPRLAVYLTIRQGFHPGLDYCCQLMRLPEFIMSHNPQWHLFSRHNLHDTPECCILPMLEA